jgi:hypothetical protein
MRDALSAFSRLIPNTHKRVFEKIFNTLETGLPNWATAPAPRPKPSAAC